PSDHRSDPRLRAGGLQLEFAAARPRDHTLRATRRHRRARGIHYAGVLRDAPAVGVATTIAFRLDRCSFTPPSVVVHPRWRRHRRTVTRHDGSCERDAMEMVLAVFFMSFSAGCLTG